MPKTEYSKKLLDPRWQKKRLEILERDGWKCLACGETKKTLHVHHMRYLTGVDPWDTNNDDLVTLCEECHEAESFGRRELTNRLVEALEIQHFFVNDIENLTNFIWSLSNAYSPEILLKMLWWFDYDDIGQEKFKELIALCMSEKTSPSNGRVA